MECLNGYTMEYIGMGILVLFENGEIANVNGDTLDNLMREKEVVAFHRSEGWVLIGSDPIRGAQQPLTRSGNRRSDILFKKPKP